MNLLQNILGSPFTGAFYRKVSSEESTELFGIRAEGTLPQVVFEHAPARYYIHPSSDDTGLGINHWQTGPMDRPSVYLGGNGDGHELDAGLCWHRVYHRGTGLATFTDDPEWCHRGDLSRLFLRVGGKLVNGLGHTLEQSITWAEMRQRFNPNFAFRPFYRTTDPPEWSNPKPGAMDNLYFFPGEPIVMGLRVVAPGRVRLDIRTADSSRHFFTSFDQVGFGIGQEQSFKRVNAVDQFRLNAAGERVGNEKKPLIKTGIRVTDASWTRVELLDATMRPSGFLAGGSVQTTIPQELLAIAAAVFPVNGANAEGGETLSILPSAMA